MLPPRTRRRRALLRLAFLLGPPLRALNRRHVSPHRRAADTRGSFPYRSDHPHDKSECPFSCTPSIKCHAAALRFISMSVWRKTYEDRLYKPAQDRKAHTQTVCEEFRPEMTLAFCFGLGYRSGMIRTCPQSKRYSDDFVRTRCSQ